MLQLSEMIVNHVPNYYDAVYNEYGLKIKAQQAKYTDNYNNIKHIIHTIYVYK